MTHARMWVALSLTLVAVFSAAPVAQAKPVEARGKIEQVTVYRGQAMVTRKVPVDAPPGEVNLVVGELPHRIVPGSLYATGDEALQVRAVRYRQRAVKEEPRPEIREIDRKLEQLAARQREIQSKQRLLSEKRKYLDQLEGFTSQKTAKEMDAGTLKVETVVSLTQFIFKQRQELAEQSLRLDEQNRSVAEEVSLLQRKRKELTSGTTRTVREAVVYLEKRGRAPATLHLNYLVEGASWSPTYTLRCAGRGQDVHLEYNALVQQMSGEDWDGVDLKLSTASPTMTAAGPILTPLWVALERVGAPDAEKIGGVERMQRQVGNLSKALRQRASNFARDGTIDPFTNDWIVNEEANRLQIMNLRTGEDVTISNQLTDISDDVLSVSYALPGRINLPSRSDKQMIQIAALELAAEFYYRATPVLTPYVYQHADIANTSDVALLSGPVDTYMDGRFMGTGNIPIVARGQKFTVGFGVDTQLRVKRELADKADEVQGGNRVQTFRYRIRIANYKDKAVKVRLLDRLPDPRGADVKVTLGELSHPLSEDELYRQTLRKMGILRWEIEVPANASGASAKVVEYQYTMEFDRNLRIAEPTKAEQERQKKDFRMDLQRMQQMQMH